MPKAGERCSEFGVFKTECCGSEIVIGVGTQFPTCSSHPGLTKWVIVPGDPDAMLDEERQIA